MKLFWGPHTCAIGSHILLEESGKSYETEKLDVAGGATQKEPFKDMNPKGKVPTLLRDDGSVLTEFGAIANWIARTVPEKHLLPSDPNGEARAVEVTDYVVGTIHGQGFGRVFKPEKFELPDTLHKATGLGASAVKEQGREIVNAGFRLLDQDSHVTHSSPATLSRCGRRSFLCGAMGAAGEDRSPGECRGPFRAHEGAAVGPQGNGHLGREMTGASMKLIGLEEHFVTDDVLAAWKALEPRWQDVALMQSDRGDTGKRLADLGDARLKAMDETGLDVQVLSLTAPGVQSLESADATALQSASNDFLAETVRSNPNATRGSRPSRHPIRRRRHVSSIAR